MPSDPHPPPPEMGKQKIWKGMVIAHSICTLFAGILLFFSAFDLIFAVVPLKFAIGLKKMVVGH